MTKPWEHVFSALYDPLLWVGERTGMAKRRRDLLSEANGRVLELGAGTGLNLPYYPDEIEELTLTEPAAPMLPKLERRLRKTDRDGQLMVASAEELPFDDDSFDTVISTLVLCTVDDPRRAIKETARVLRPGGKLLFLEHVRAEDAGLARWQDRLERPWRFLGDGCHCNRDTVATIEASPLTLDRVERGELPKAPPLVRPLVRGSATLPA